VSGASFWVVRTEGIANDKQTGKGNGQDKLELLLEDGERGYRTRGTGKERGSSEKIGYNEGKSQGIGRQMNRHFLHNIPAALR